MATFVINTPDGRFRVGGVNTEEEAYKMWEQQNAAQPTVEPEPLAKGDKIKDVPADVNIPDVPTWESVGRGALNFASGGFNDEIIGGAQTGFGLWGDYPKAIEHEREVEKRAQDANPAAFFGGQIGGGVASIPALPLKAVQALPLIGNIAKAVPWLGRTVQGTTAGATNAALYGAGTTEGGASDRLAGALQEAPMGALAGGAASTALDAMLAGGRAAYQKPKAVYDAISNPTKAAQNRLAVGAQADMRSPQRGALTPADEFAAGVNQQPLMNVDRYGSNVRRITKNAKDISPDAENVIMGELGERFATQRARTEGIVRAVSPSRGVWATKDAIERAARAANRPAYKAAYEAGDRVVVSPKLEQLMSTPQVEDAIKDAIKTGKGRAVADGFGGFNSPFSITQDGRIVRNKGPSGVPAYPNIQFWDYTYRALRDQAIASTKPSEKQMLTALYHQMSDELDRIVPEYAAARGGAATAFGARDAVDLGEMLFSGKGIGDDQARAMLAKLPQAERALVEEAFTEGLVNKIRNITDGRDVVKAISNSPAAKARIELVLGPGKFREIEAGLAVERIMQASNKYMGGSDTARNLLTNSALAVGGGTAGYAYGGQSPQSAVAGAIMALGTRKGVQIGKQVVRHIDVQVANEIADLVTSTDPARIQRGLQIAARNDAIMDALRSFEAPVAGIAGKSTVEQEPLPHQQVSP